MKTYNIGINERGTAVADKKYTNQPDTPIIIYNSGVYMTMQTFIIPLFDCILII